MNSSTSHTRSKYEGYCVYLHICSANNRVFYIGKGKGNRPWVSAKSSRTNIWHNFVNKYGPHRVELIKTGLTESEAFELECETIANAIKDGFKLVNLTSGGEGFAGGQHSAKTIQTIRKYHLLKSEPLGNNPRRGVYFIKDDNNFSSSITLSFGEKRRQFSLGRHKLVEDAIAIREQAESTYIAKGLDGLVKFIEDFRATYDTHSTRRQSIVVILENKRIWFKGISEAAHQLGYKGYDLSNMLYGKSKSIKVPANGQKIYGVFYSKYKSELTAKNSGELDFNPAEVTEVDYRVTAAKARSKAHIVGFENGEINWYPSLINASEFLGVSSAGLISIRKSKLHSLASGQAKIIFVKQSNSTTEAEAIAAGELNVDLSNLIGKDYHKINAPNQIPHVAVDSNGKRYWFRSAAVMCRELKFSNYGLLKNERVKFLSAEKVRLVKIFESNFLTEELALSAGEI